VLDSSILVAALATPNPASASRIILAAAAAGVVRYSAKVNRQAFVSAVVAVAERVEGGELRAERG
jgi:predicted nucleic acid-binding protein